MELRKGEIHSHQQPNRQKSKIHIMGNCAEVFLNATRIQDPPLVNSHYGKTARAISQLEHNRYAHQQRLTQEKEECVL